MRKGNRKNIRDWDDLGKPGVSVITPNPKTSAGARWNFLAAWGYAFNRGDGKESAARSFVTNLYRNVPVLDSGARGWTDTFVERGTVGWLAQWKELVEDPEQKVARSRQIYTGHDVRDVVSIEKRKPKVAPLAA